ncbi:MAG TPA: GNAT family N-acetyltransferase, partial [Novosphingobium sp.]|nr:GNAT family N-acetyltransferase [Novosphingobium sp.]
MPFELLDLGRARIVPFANRHLGQRYVGWLNDPAVVRYSEQRHRRHDFASCEAYFRSIRASGNLFLAIEAKDPAIGHCGNMTASFDPPNRTCDLSIMVGEAAARGTGIGSMAWCAMVDWLLGPGGQRRVTAGT